MSGCCWFRGQDLCGLVGIGFVAMNPHGDVLSDGLRDLLRTPFAPTHLPHDEPGLATPTKLPALQLLDGGGSECDVCCRCTRKGVCNEQLTVGISCAKDEGWPLGIGFQEQVPNQSKLLRSKSVVVSREL